MSYFTNFTFVFVALISCCHCIVWQDCGSAQGKVSSVAVSGCSPSQKICNLVRGQNVTFSVGFLSKEVAPQTTAVVHGVVAGVPMPFPIPNPDGCKNSGLKCPLAANKPYMYKTTIPVLTSYPKIRVVVKWELRDAAHKDLFCIEVAAQIVDAAKSKKDTILRFRKRFGLTNVV